MNISKNNFSSIEQMTGSLLSNKTQSTTPYKDNKKISFDDVLKTKQQQQEEDELKFSKHANERLQDRNINLSNAQIERLKNATSKAREKGIKESLVMVDNLAFIVNVKNNTVITAVNETEDTIFTNIDGAVIM